jgi:hypothetical protein
MIAAVVMSFNYSAKKLLLFRRTPSSQEHSGPNMDETSQ